MKSISKVLTKTDAHKGNSHEFGVAFPKKVIEYAIKAEILPELSKDIKNPIMKLHFIDETNEEWVFTYIFYNSFYSENKQKGKKEYRLAAMTKYIKKMAPNEGDVIKLSIDDNGLRHVEIQKQHEAAEQKKVKKIVLCGGWHYFEYE